MTKANKCSPEVRERAVRMVQEHRGEYPSLWAAIELIAPKIGCVPQTLHEWVRKQEIDTGMREGTTSEERDRIEGARSQGTAAGQRDPERKSTEQTRSGSR
jgi:transposase